MSPYRAITERSRMPGFRNETSTAELRVGEASGMNFRLPGRAFEQKPKEACGVFGISGHPDAAKLTYFGLYALQHRGQESAGIAAAGSGSIDCCKGMGLVPEVFDPAGLGRFEGRPSAIGHVRYSTTGESVPVNAQPFVVTYKGESYGVAHNGNLVNARLLKDELEETGSIFQSTMDSEIFLHLFVRNLGFGFEEALSRTVRRLKGAYSMVLLAGGGKLAGIKDPSGFRPLCLGYERRPGALRDGCGGGVDQGWPPR